MKELKIFVGLSDCEGKENEKIKKEFKRLLDVIVKETGGATVLNSKGYYTNKHNKIIEENSRVIITYLSSTEKENKEKIRIIKTAITYFLKTTKQESTIIELKDVNIEFFEL